MTEKNGYCEYQVFRMCQSLLICWLRYDLVKYVLIKSYMLLAWLCPEYMDGASERCQGKQVSQRDFLALIDSDPCMTHVMYEKMSGAPVWDIDKLSPTQLHALIDTYATQMINSLQSGSTPLATSHLTVRTRLLLARWWIFEIQTVRTAQTSEGHSNRCESDICIISMGVWLQSRETSFSGRIRY
jgi:hypothetical protein